MLASAGVGVRGSSAELSGPPVGPVRVGYGKEKGGGVRLGRRAGQARREREKRARPDPGVGLKMEEGEFFKFKFFSNF